MAKAVFVIISSETCPYIFSVFHCELHHQTLTQDHLTLPIKFLYTIGTLYSHYTNVA